MDRNSGKSRQAEVSLVDTAGTPLRLIDYEGAETQVDWKAGYQYQISRCKAQKGGGGYDLELAPSKRTRITPLGPVEECTRILIVGDTHVGRTKHPRTGEKIDPIDAFSTAVAYGIERSVDAVVHVGDIFHDTATPVQALFVDQTVFDPLADAGIPFYYVRGNHQSTAGNELLEDRDGTLASNIDTSGVSVNSTLRLFGINHHPEGDLQYDNLEFPDTVIESTSILVLHQTLAQLTDRGTKSVDLDQIIGQFSNRFDFILCGHHHDATRQDWCGVPVMYTGAVERMSTNTDPTDRVAWLLTVADDSVSCEQYNIP
ncbi:metallophosphoesterase family protein [Halapricum desulfuricans]|uniref:DNA repair exonuclease, SbcD n=1 Tax=Halapricum desulfuricans TaxID=2841257 RepID=A0A897NTX8_9EURY|nr:metallophosphoesterase [Halapricum desulfuricans]QSG16362.1 DNA repair exonuclease, SbcD [Halapricum desulfuricans]